MTQPNRPRKGAQPASRQSPVGAAISAALVVVVFVVLGYWLVQRAAPAAPTQPTQDTFAYATASAVALAGAPTAPPAPTAAGDTASRNGKYKAPPPETIDPKKNYTATITTPRGDIVIQLRPDLAPKTVNSFVFLAREGFYDGLTWHRVIPGFVAQGGDPAGDGTGGPGYSVPAEFTDKVLYDKPGIVAMARANDPNSAGSQFFITLGPAPNLNNQYTIFGEVIKGLEVVQGIPERDPQAATTPGEKILKITIAEQ